MKKFLISISIALISVLSLGLIACGPKTVDATSVSLDKTAIVLKVGETSTLTATVSPSNATDKTVTFSSSNTGIATVSDSGVVTAVAVGDAIITVSTANGKTATCEVAVEQDTTPGPAVISVESVSLDLTTLELYVGNSQALVATVSPSDATNKEVTYSSSAVGVATVDGEGNVTAVAVGTATITVTTVDGNKTATCEVTVSELPPQSVAVESVALNETTTSLVVGTEVTLTATVSPSDATNKAVTYSSSAENVATVDNNGKVTAVAVGTAIITVTTADGNKTATCEVTVTPILVSSVALDKTTLYLEVNSQGTLIATVEPSNAANKAVTYSSSAENVATVDNEGNVTAVAVGTATITVTTVDGNKTATCVVSVVPQIISVTSVSLNKTTLDLLVGANETLIATVAPSDATNKAVTYSSSAEGVATVDNEGNVTAVAVGTATITVTTEDGSKTATCTVTVNPIAVTGVTLNKTTLELLIGANETLIATIAPENATNKNYTFSSNVESVATVDNTGKVTAVAVGTAIITVTTEDGSKTATCTVTVNPIAVTGVTLNKTTLELLIGANETLIATIAPENATNKNYTFSSNVESVATVDSTGKVTAIAEGTATITVTTADGSKTATCTVTVNPVAVTGVTLNKTSATLIVGGQGTLIATVAPENATNKNVSFSSSAEDVATVDSTGKVTAIAKGTTTITVTTADGSITATCVITVITEEEYNTNNNNAWSPLW